MRKIHDQHARRNDNDVFGHMNNPYYGVLIDSIVNQYLHEHAGYRMQKGPMAAIIANTYCDYFGSVKYPGEVDVGMRVVKLGKSSVVYEVGVFARGDPDVKAVGGSTHVWVEQRAPGVLGKTTKDGVPAEAREAYMKLLREDEGGKMKPKL